MCMGATAARSLRGADEAAQAELYRLLVEDLRLAAVA